MTTFIQNNIHIPINAKGQLKVKCPACTPHLRKAAHRNNKDLSVNVEDGIWNCHNCGWKGTLKQKSEKEWTRPVEINLPLSEKSIKWLNDRGLKPNTIKAFNLSEEKNFILFPYYKNGEIVNYKYRDLNKNFKLTSGAELCIFNYDKIYGKNKIVITEGEIDCMSVYECGFYDVCSVPNGASKGNQRLEYIDASWLAFSEAEDIVIATDNDEAGIALKIELVRRLGKERCRFVEYPDNCKDFNEVLLLHGAAKVLEMINVAKTFPVDGIMRLSDFQFDLDEIYEHGFNAGAYIGYDDFDKHLNFSLGQLTTIVGIPSSGKSAFLDQVLIRLAEKYQWNIGVCSFENQPVTRHAANLSSVYIGQPFYRRTNEKMKPNEYIKAKEFLHKYFFWFKMKDEDCSLEGIIERAKQLVRTHGIKCLVIDPYNYIEHSIERGQTETQYISLFLSTLANFCKDYQVHTFLVAHPTKMKKGLNGDFEIPNLYDISGSAHFFNKTDNGISVYRDRKTNLVSVYIQKVRFFYNGKLGFVDFNYDINTGKYNEVGKIPMPPNNPYAGINNMRQLPKEKEVEENNLPF